MKEGMEKSLQDQRKWPAIPSALREYLKEQAGTGETRVRQMWDDCSLLDPSPEGKQYHTNRGES